MESQNPATESPPQESPPPTIGEIHDLTSLTSPPFRYKLRPVDKDGNPAGEGVVYSVDFEMATMELFSRIPTALRPYTEIVDEKTGARRMVTGWEYLWVECIKKGVPIPDELPSVPHVVDAVAKAFKIPPDHRMSTKLAVFASWLEEANRRAMLKKDGPQSLNSPEPTPA